MSIDRQIIELIDDKLYEHNLAMHEYILNGVVLPFREDIRKIESKLGMAETGQSCGALNVGSPYMTSLPLKACVATALGKKTLKPNKYDLMYKWRYDPGNLSEGELYPRIPDYDKHVDLAIGALEEYCDNCDIRFKIRYSRDLKYSIDIAQYWADFRERNRNPLAKGANLPQAICEAIAKHAEQSK